MFKNVFIQFEDNGGIVRIANWGEGGFSPSFFPTLLSPTILSLTFPFPTCLFPTISFHSFLSLPFLFSLLRKRKRKGQKYNDHYKSLDSDGEWWCWHVVCS